jgi:protein-tyrosine phosphatase
MENLTNIRVKRTAEGNFKITWKSHANNLSVSIFAGDSPDSIDLHKPLIHTSNPSGIVLRDLDPDVRYYFAVTVDGSDPIVTAERRIVLEGAHNFRDLGGYPTTDGYRIKWNRIYRSDTLARITKNDQRTLKKIGIKMVCDLRAPAEVQKSPDALPEDGSIDYLNFSIVSGNMDTVAAMEKIKKGDTTWLTEEYMIEGYRNNIDNYAHVWGAFFERIVSPDSYPLVFHCTGGKDRAGVCAALILLALGVSEKTVIYDHGLSNKFLADILPKIYDYFSSFGVDKEKLMPYLTAPRAAIISVLGHIRTEYGSAVDYLKNMAGVEQKTLDRLKQEMLD